MKINNLEDKNILWVLFCVLLVLFLFLMVIIQRQDINNLHSRQKFLDSCIQSNFEETINCSRIEQAIEMIEKKHPEISSELDSLFILSE